MATSPQFGATAVFAYNTTAITAANTAADGTGTVVFMQENASGTATDLVLGATGAFIDRLEIIPRGTNVATVMRLFANANATNATAANNNNIGEVTCPVSTVSQVAALAPVVLQVKKWFPANTKFFVTIGTAVAAGFSVGLYGSEM
jgi:hypothetical protein